MLTFKKREALIAGVLGYFEKIRQPARKEYNKIRQAAWEEYNKIRQAAWEEYEKIEQAARKEYEKITQPARKEYEKIISKLQLGIEQCMEQQKVNRRHKDATIFKYNEAMFKYNSDEESLLKAMKEANKVIENLNALLRKE